MRAGLAVLLGILLATFAGLATETAVARSPGLGVSAPAAKPGLRVRMNTGGMDGMEVITIQPHLAGDAGWLKATGYSMKDIGAIAETRLRRITGLRLAPSQSATIPRLLVQVVGHTIQGYGEGDPPAVTHITVALSQDASVRRGARSIPVTALTYTITMLSTGRASTMRDRVRDKLEELLGEFEQDYHRANPR